MNGLLRNILIVTLTLFAFSSCKKKAFDDYYYKTNNLAAPIYQQLQSRGNFKNLLACIDKAGYRDILGSAGYWTFFAPNDSAFKKFFVDRGISSVSQIDSATARDIVSFCLVYNAFAKARLGDFQDKNGWVANQAFRRRTANYLGYHNDTTFTGQILKVVDINRNTGTLFVGDNNNKYIPYFLSNFMTARGLSASDYNYFYPNTPYTGFNVANASVVTPDIPAENGYIHEIDRVILPLKNIEQYLAAKPEYSEFKKLFDKYMLNYFVGQNSTVRYHNLTGLNDTIYVKYYNTNLAFSLNNENYQKVTDNDAQTNSYTLFAPKNDAFIKYRDSVLLEHYPSLDVVPQSIIIDFLSAHMFTNVVWPTKFSSTTNVQSEPARFDPSADVIDKQILSNGNFYGTSKVQAANVFSTVYGKPYLDPNYSLMTRALDLNLRYSITVPSVKYTVFMMSDALLRAKGYDYNFTQSQWQYTVPGTTNVTVSSTVRDNLLRILATHVVKTPNDEMKDLSSGSGIIETYGGEYIKWNSGKLSSAGTGTYKVTAGASKVASNGRVYYSDSLLEYSDTLVGTTLKKLANAPGSDFSYFYQYLSSSSLYTASNDDITGVKVGGFYTLFVPNNDAIVYATQAGLLPVNSDSSLNFTPTELSDQILVNNFIKYHIVSGTTIITDGTKLGKFNTLYKDASGGTGTISLNKSSNGIVQLKDQANINTINFIMKRSNILANRCTIHLIDNYLQY